MKKILFAITKSNFGGAQRYVFDLATHLPEGCEPLVVLGGEGSLKTRLEEKSIRTISLTSLARDVHLGNDAQVFFELIHIFRQERPNVVHLNSSKMGALGAVAARVAGVPRVVFTAHGWPFKEERSAFARAAIYALSWLTVVFSHATIVVSKQDETLGRRMWLIGKKIHYVPLGIEPPQFLSREDAEEKLHIATHNPRIVTIAELTRNKGIRYAIEAIAKLKKRGVECEYFVIGDGEERDLLEKHMNELHIGDRVQFLGYIAEAATYLKAFDVFVLPSIKEGMPYVLLEAAATNMPIVATRAVDASFAEENAVLVHPDGDSIAAALQSALTLPSEPSRSRSPFLLARMLEQTIGLY